MLSANKRLIDKLALCCFLLLPVQPTSAGEAIASKEAAQPDERILWQLFHAGKISEVKRQIANLRQSYPLWRPPESLLHSLAGTAATGQQLKQTHAQTISRPSFCASAAEQRRRAERETRQHQAGKAAARYRKLIRLCESSLARQTLVQARSVLALGEFITLAEFSKAYLATPFVDRQIYDALKIAYLSKHADPRAEPAPRLQAGIERYRDWRTAIVVAWRSYDRQAYSQALDWFQRVSSWGQSDDDARYGQMLCLEKLKQYERLSKLYSEIQQPSTRIKVVAARAYKAMAWRSYNRKQWTGARENVELARAIVGEDEDVLALSAWIALKTQQLPQAARLFERLYQHSPNSAHAQAYILAQSRLDRGLLSDKAEQSGGVLADEYQRFHARELYQRKQFQSAYRLAPQDFPALTNIDSTYLHLEGGALHRSGEHGRSHLDLYRLPSLTVSNTVDGNHQFALNVTRVALFSGSLQQCGAEIGGFPDRQFANQCRQLTQSQSLPEQRLDDALAVEFSYRKDGWFSPYASLGGTPIGGVIEPDVTFRLGFVQQTGYGNWGLETFSQPVRQSLLSYTGARDPYRDELDALFNEKGYDAWGGVLKTGFKASQFVRFLEHWNVAGAIEYDWLHGENVADNHAVAVALALGRELDVDGFDYFSVGPSVNYQHFDNNLGHFTFGHGGYFSPKHYYNIGAGVNFLTDEGRNFIIQGRFSAGMQVIEEDEAPWFPRGNAALGKYAGNKSSGEALDFELKGVWLLTPHIQLGAGAAFRKTNGYQDYTGGLFIRYTLEQRQAVFSRDLPQSLFTSYY